MKVHFLHCSLLKGRLSLTRNPAERFILTDCHFFALVLNVPWENKRAQVKPSASLSRHGVFAQRGSRRHVGTQSNKMNFALSTPGQP